MSGDLAGRWAALVTLDAVYLVGRGPHGPRLKRIPAQTVSAPVLHGDGEWLDVLGELIVEVGKPLHVHLVTPGSATGTKLRQVSTILAAVEVDLDANRVVFRHAPGVEALDQTKGRG